MKRLAFIGIVLSGNLGFAIGVYGRALYDDGWPF